MYSVRILNVGLSSKTEAVDFGFMGPMSIWLFRNTNLSCDPEDILS